jgi:hypothetical protein
MPVQGNVNCGEGGKMGHKAGTFDHNPAISENPSISRGAAADFMAEPGARPVHCRACKLIEFQNAGT